jgi:AraC-like DNA-binding protein
MMQTAETPRQRRLGIDFARFGIKPFCHLGKYDYDRTQGELPLHHHLGTLEICYLVKGRQVYSVAGRNYVLSGGDVYITFPDEKHSSGGFPEEKGVLYWFLIRLKGIPKNQELLGLTPAMGRQLARTLLNLPSRHFKGQPRLQELLDSMVLLSMQEGDPLKKVSLCAVMVEFLLLVIACSRKNIQSQSSQEMTALLRYIDEHLDRPLPVPALASQLLLSTSRFKARFKMEIGMGPAEYVLRRRIAAAQEVLKRSQASVTQVGLQLGFSSSQNFATAFKRFCSMSPSKWTKQNQIRNENF